MNRLGWRAWQQFTQAHVHLYRLSGGRLGGKFRGSPVLLLDHVGRKSGKRHTSPLIYVEVYAPYEDCQRKTERDIPVIVLERA